MKCIYNNFFGIHALDVVLFLIERGTLGGLFIATARLEAGYCSCWTFCADTSRWHDGIPLFIPSDLCLHCISDG